MPLKDSFESQKIHHTPRVPTFLRGLGRTARSVGVMNSGISDPEVRKKKLNAEQLGDEFGRFGRPR